MNDGIEHFFERLLAFKSSVVPDVNEETMLKEWFHNNVVEMDGYSDKDIDGDITDDESYQFIPIFNRKKHAPSLKDVFDWFCIMTQNFIKLVNPTENQKSFMRTEFISFMNQRDFFEYNAKGKGGNRRKMKRSTRRSTYHKMRRSLIRRRK